jgi:hypothetical protein
LCRADTKSDDGKRQVVDAFIRERSINGSKSFLGHVILGIYAENGTLEKKYDMGEVPVAANTQSNGSESYVSKTALAGEVFVLQVIDSGETLIGNLGYLGDVPPPGEHVDSIGTMDRYKISNLNCYRQ